VTGVLHLGSIICQESATCGINTGGGQKNSTNLMPLNGTYPSFYGLQEGEVMRIGTMKWIMGICVLSTVTMLMYLMGDRLTAAQPTSGDATSDQMRQAWESIGPRGGAFRPLTCRHGQLQSNVFPSGGLPGVCWG